MGSDAPVLAVAVSAFSFHEDVELVRRACARDARAEEALYRRHVEAVTRVAIRLMGATSEVDDVVQDAFLHALEHLGELTDGAAFRAWVRRIAVSVCHRRFRRQKLLRALGFGRFDDGDVLDAMDQGTSRADLRADLRDVERALAGASETVRSTFLLHRIEGWTLEETAAALETSLATAKRRLAEADARIADLRGGRT